MAKECRHVTESGTRTGVSTTAFLHARPRSWSATTGCGSPRWTCARAAGGTEFVFRQEDVLGAAIEETDLLFIDTLHDYDQLRQELRRHAGKARKYVVLHDTTTFAEKGETPGRRGLWPAVEELLAEGTFRLKARTRTTTGSPYWRRSGRMPGRSGRAILVEARPTPVEAAPAEAVPAAPHQPPDGASPAGPQVRMAVVCIAHDEEELIGPFLDHYFGHGADAVFVVDNDFADETAAIAAPAQRRGGTDGEWGAGRGTAHRHVPAAARGVRRWVRLGAARGLRRVPGPQGGDTLREALAKHPGASVLGAEGWDVVQRPGDSAVDWGRPLLAQRGSGVPNPAYDKPVVLRPSGPERLAPGQHYLLGGEPSRRLRPFLLLHLAACDQRLFFKRRRKMTARQGLKNIQKGL